MKVDVAIVGAGMAGASLAWHLRDHASTLLLEAEDAPGYHTTGRSAAFWVETYGGPGVRPLTAASLAFLNAPPAGFADVPLVRRRGGLHVADAAGQAILDTFAESFADTGVELQPLDEAATLARLPQLRDGWRERSVWEPGCLDIDVAALHAGFLRGSRVLSGAALRTAARGSGRWRLGTSAGPVEADVLVNAAGAWADTAAVVAGARPLGVVPYRRTIVVADVDPTPPVDLPLVIDAAGRLYFKPEAGLLLISPHDETRDTPRDVAAEEIDIATAIDRFEHTVDWPVRRVVRAWAGLRTFAPDRLPLLGPDAHVPGLFWCAGQGGFGIQTAPAAGRLLADLILGRTPLLDPAPYAVARFA